MKFKCVLFIFFGAMWLKVNAQETRNIKALLDSFPIAQNFSKPANWKEADKDRTFYYSN